MRDSIPRTGLKIALGFVTLALGYFLTICIPYVSLGRQSVADFSSLIFPIIYVLTVAAIDLKERPPSRSPTTDADKLHLEYQSLSESVRARENSLLLTGSIFVTASTVLLSQFPMKPEDEQFELVLGSWILYGTWLFLFQLTAARGTDITFRRLRGIEERLGILVHRYLAQKRDPVRKWIWLSLLDGLFVIGYSFLGLDYSILRISFFIQLVFVVIHSLVGWIHRGGRHVSDSTSMTRRQACLVEFLEVKDPA